MNAAKKLLGFDLNPNNFATRAPRSPKIPSEQLEILEGIVKAQDGTGFSLPDREGLREVYQFFKNMPLNKLASAFDSVRRVRQLALALTYFEGRSPAIVETKKLQNALQLIDRCFRISMLPAVFNALMKAWHTPNARTLRAFLKKHLTDYAGYRKSIQKLKDNMTWYCEEDGALQFAMSLITSRRKLADVWELLDLPDYMHGYPYFGDVVTEYVSYNSRLNAEHVTDIVDFVIKHNNDKTSRRVLSKLIEKLGIEATETLRQPVQSYALQEWQDPRITGGDVRWRDVSDKAREIFTRWITKEDLRFFFDVVAKACYDPKFAYRKAFWLAYLKHISFCRPVLRKDVEYLFQSDRQALRYYRDRRPATLNGGTSDQHAFIIQMEEFTFVEFSTAGACYVYHNADLPFELGDSEYYMSELRSWSFAKHRVIHHRSENYSWQDEFASWLEDEIGIEALRSYQLEPKSDSDPIKSDSVIIKCPNENCGQRLTITTKKGIIKRIRCPNCLTAFEKYFES
ncbi:MAG: hypothetical protein F4X56_00010 [Gammaproteobacteria bacterium]|nr:hypothetical protein [Candidatus Poribacteria bacterium]MYC24281.1 hypothetical protein [Gammaproteobacteria bacterium]